MKIHLFRVVALLFGLIGQSQAGKVQDISLPKNSEHQKSFASCLLVKDDNNRLIEWMAYHYHTLPLRRLIVMMDPQSQTDPRTVLDRWSDKIDVDIWLDKDVFSEKEHQDGREMAVQHSTLHQAFNVKCIQTLKDEGRKWTLMTDADEYLYLNPKAWDPSDSLYLSDVEPIGMSESGAMMKFLNKVNLSDERFHGQEWEACFPITRLQLGELESSSDEIEKNFPKTLEPSLLPSDFDTFRLRHYEANIPGKSEIPGKTLINLSKLPDDYQKRLIGNPHHPIDVLCDRENVFLPEEKNHFLASHMLRTKDQFSAKEDSRFYSEAIAFGKRMEAGGRITDELRPWLSSFVDNVGKEEAHRLLLSTGQVQTPTFDLPKCSINFFGLPRSFESLSLPSIVKNVLLTNAKYSCDIFVHFYSVETETEGRLNTGGTHDITAVYELESVVKLAAAHEGHNAPTVKIMEQTKEQFDAKYGDLVTHYLTSEDPNTGKPMYFPWKNENYNTKSIENIVMQWNSLQSCWQMMEKHAMNVGIDYKRVAYFRLDAFYAFPVDIYKINKDTYDYSNRYAVLPGFAKYPVNDRMFYGPSKAVKIWATERFDRLQHYISSSTEEGYGMHSERYVGHGLVPSITKETGYSVIENNDICFFRTRASDILLLNDCSDGKGGVTRGIEDVDTKRLVEEIINRDCEITPFDNSGRFLGLDCSEPEDNTMTSLVSVRMLNETPEPTYPPFPFSMPTPSPIFRYEDGKLHIGGYHDDNLSIEPYVSGSFEGESLNVEVGVTLTISFRRRQLSELTTFQYKNSSEPSRFSTVLDKAVTKTLNDHFNLEVFQVIRHVSQEDGTAFLSLAVTVSCDSACINDDDQIASIMIRLIETVLDDGTKLEENIEEIAKQDKVSELENVNSVSRGTVILEKITEVTAVPTSAPTFKSNKKPKKSKKNINKKSKVPKKTKVKKSKAPKNSKKAPEKNGVNKNKSL